MAAPDETIRQVTEAAIKRLDLQLDLPREAETWSWHFHLPAALVWSGVILGAAVVLYFIARDVLPGLLVGRRAGGEDGVAGTAGEGPPAASPVQAADALAREGRFVEAMHALLLQGLAEIRSRGGAAIAESLTSREILRHLPLPDVARASLGEIVGRVEWSYFGEHPAGAADYSACRESFDRLAAALATGGGR